MDFHFSCPSCHQQLVGSIDDVGADAVCPICENHFVIPPGPVAAPAAAVTPVVIPTAVKQWVVEMRVLIRQAPPAYVKIMVEVPTAWDLPLDVVLPQAAMEAAMSAVRARFPQCPITPIKVEAADAEARKRASGVDDYHNEICRAWVLGRVASSY